MMDDGRSLAVTLLMVNDVPANQEIFEPLARKRRDCDWWIHDLMIETFLSDFKEEIVNIMMTAQTLAWRRKVDRVTANHYLSLTASQETSNIPFP